MRSRLLSIDSVDVTAQLAAQQTKRWSDASAAAVLRVEAAARQPLLVCPDDDSSCVSGGLPLVACVPGLDAIELASQMQRCGLEPPQVMRDIAQLLPSFMKLYTEALAALHWIEKVCVRWCYLYILYPYIQTP